MNDFLKKMLGQYLLERRQELGISQVEVSRALGFSPQFMGRIEKGDVGIPEAALVRAIQFLELDPARLRKIFTYSASCYADKLLESAKRPTATKSKQIG